MAVAMEICGSSWVRHGDGDGQDGFGPVAELGFRGRLLRGEPIEEIDICMDGGRQENGEITCTLTNSDRVWP